MASVSLLRHAVSAVLLLLCVGLSHVHAGSAQPVYPQAHWTRSPSASSGWSEEKFQAADDTARSIGTCAYVVVHRGVIVHGFGPIDKPMNLASMRKSVLSVLYGIEVERGHVELSKTLNELGVSDRGGLSDLERTATIRQLLQARSGVYYPAAYETSGMKVGRPDRGSHAPGTFWYYNNWDFNALGTIFEKLAGHGVFSALDTELARPLQFEDFEVDRDTESVYETLSEHPAYVMRLSARDVARIGLLMARGGRWQERELVSRRWIDESTTPYSDTSRGVGYGYLWWVGRDHWQFGQEFPGPVFSARGNFGQFLLVDPVRDLVVATGSTCDCSHAR